MTEYDISNNNHNMGGSSGSNGVEGLNSSAAVTLPEDDNNILVKEKLVHDILENVHEAMSSTAMNTSTATTTANNNNNNNNNSEHANNNNNNNNTNTIQNHIHDEKGKHTQNTSTTTHPHHHQQHQHKRHRIKHANQPVSTIMSPITLLDSEWNSHKLKMPVIVDVIFDTVTSVQEFFNYFLADNAPFSLNQ